MIRIVLAASAMTFGLSSPVGADVPGRDWIASAKVSKMLAKKGYRVTKIEADDGHWEGEAARKGMRYDFHVDPHSGRITKMQRDRD